MENILENQARTLHPHGPDSTYSSSFCCSCLDLRLGIRRGQDRGRTGRGQGSQRPWQTRFMIWLSRGEREPAKVCGMKSSPVFPRGATVPKAGASIWPCCVVHLSPWSPGPSWPHFCHLYPQPLPSAASAVEFAGPTGALGEGVACSVPWDPLLLHSPAGAHPSWCLFNFP